MKTHKNILSRHPVTIPNKIVTISEPASQSGYCRHVSIVCLEQCFPNLLSSRTIKHGKNLAATKFLNNYSADHKLDDFKRKLTILMVNWFEIGIFFLADQINNSCGPKMVRGPDFGKHWSRMWSFLMNFLSFKACSDILNTFILSLT